MKEKKPKPVASCTNCGAYSFNAEGFNSRMVRTSILRTLKGGPSKLRLGGCSSVTDHPEFLEQSHGVPWSLKHFQQSGQNHFLTFSCYHRQPKLAAPAPRDLFIRALE